MHNSYTTYRSIINDGQLKVNRGPILRKLKSGEPPEQIESKKNRSLKIYILISIYYSIHDI